MTSFFDELPDYDGGSKLTTNKKEEMAPKEEPSLFDSLEDIPESKSAEWGDVAGAIPQVVESGIVTGIAGLGQAFGEASPMDVMRQASDLSGEEYAPGWIVSALDSMGMDGLATAAESVGELYQGAKNVMELNPLTGAIHKALLGKFLDTIGADAPAWMAEPVAPSFAEDMQLFREDIQRETQLALPENMTTSQQVAVDVATSVGVSLPVMAAMGLTRGKGSQAFAMGMPGVYYYGHTYGSEYAEAREKGLTEAEARSYANEQSVIMTAAELVGVEYLNKALRTRMGDGLLKAIGAHMLSEGVGSGASAMMMDLNAIDTGISDKSIDQVFWDGLYAAATASVGGPVQSGTALAMSGTVSAAAAGSAWMAERVAPVWMERRRIEAELASENPQAVDAYLERQRQQELAADKITEEVDMSGVALTGELVEEQEQASYTSPYAQPGIVEPTMAEGGWTWTTAESAPDSIVQLLEEVLADEMIVEPDGTVRRSGLNEQSANRAARRQRADLGLTPDIIRAAMQQGRRQAQADPVLALEHRLGTEIVVDENGEARFATVNEQNAMLAVRQNMMAMGMTPDILRAINRIQTAFDAGLITEEQHDNLQAMLVEVADSQKDTFVNTEAMLDPSGEQQLEGVLNLIPKLTPITEAPKTAFPKQRQADLDLHRENMAGAIADMKAAGMQVTQSVIDNLSKRFEPVDVRDTTTAIYGRGFHRPERRVEIARRAQEWIRQNPGDAAWYIEGDLANLAGLNKALFPSNADKVYSAMAQIITNTLRSKGLVVEPIRRGGDELVWIAVGPINQAGIDAALAEARAKMAEYTAEHDLDGIEHGKEKKEGAPGTTILIAPAQLTADIEIGPVMDEAMARVEELKVQRHEAYIKARNQKLKETQSVKRTQRGASRPGRARPGSAQSKARGNPPRLRRGEGGVTTAAERADAKRDAIREAVDPVIQALGVNARAIPMSEMPEHLRRYAAERKTSFAGVYDPATSTIYLNTDALSGPADAMRTLLHEAVGHLGLRQLFAANGRVDVDAFQSFLDNVYLSNKAGIDAVWQQFPDYDPSSREQRREASEEFIAHMAEEMDSVSAFQKIYEAIISFISKAVAKMGGRMPPITISDLRRILSNARRNLEAHTEGSITSTDPAMFSAGRDPFFSQLKKTIIDDSKGRFPQSATADKWIAAIERATKQGLFKSQELNWSGLMDVLQDATVNNPAEPISRENIVRFLNQEGVLVDLQVNLSSDGAESQVDAFMEKIEHGSEKRAAGDAQFGDREYKIIEDYPGSFTVYESVGRGRANVIDRFDSMDEAASHIYDLAEEFYDYNDIPEEDRDVRLDTYEYDADTILYDGVVIYHANLDEDGDIVFFGASGANIPGADFLPDNINTSNPNGAIEYIKNEAEDYYDENLEGFSEYTWENSQEGVAPKGYEEIVVPLIHARRDAVTGGAKSAANRERAQAGMGFVVPAHFKQPDILVHVRASMRSHEGEVKSRWGNSNNVYFVNEIQSDWSQRGRSSSRVMEHRGKKMIVDDVTSISISDTQTAAVEKEISRILDAQKDKSMEWFEEHASLESKQLDINVDIEFDDGVKTSSVSSIGIPVYATAPVAKDSQWIRNRIAELEKDIAIFSNSDSSAKKRSAEVMSGEVAALKKVQSGDRLSVKDILEISLAESFVYARRNAVENYNSQIPQNPFMENAAWIDLGVKTAIRRAVENGANYLQIAPGSLAERMYGLGSVIKEAYLDETVHLDNGQTGYVVRAVSASGDRDFDVAKMLNNENTQESHQGYGKSEKWKGANVLALTEEGVVAAFGKETAKQIIGSDGSRLAVEDFIGEKWARIFYDQRVPKVLERIAKSADPSIKLISNFESTNPDADMDSEAPRSFAIEITDKLREQAYSGFPLFQRRGDDMGTERGKKKTGRGIVTEAEKASLKKMSEKIGAPANKVIAALRQLRSNYPTSDGWSMIEVKGIEKASTKKSKKPVDDVIDDNSIDIDGFKLIIKAQKYAFADGPNGKIVTKDKREARINKLAKKMVAEVEKVVERATGTGKDAEAARVILAQANWYSQMRIDLRRNYGAFGDLFADLLGATSPQTPVASNWTFAQEALRNLSEGKYDDAMHAYHQHVQNLNRLEARLAAKEAELRETMTVDQAKATPEYKELAAMVSEARKYGGPLALRGEGMDKKFGVNSMHVMKALYGTFRVMESGASPKMRFFSGNLIGWLAGATVDVWASRTMNRLAGLPRIPPKAEQGLQGDVLVSGNIGGAYGLAQDVFARAGEALGMEPDALQAVVWFIEKELWHTNGWTTEEGKGGSFIEEMKKDPASRHMVFMSLDRDKPATSEQRAAALRAIQRTAKRDPAVRFMKATPTVGVYYNAGVAYEEGSFDIEVITHAGTVPHGTLAQAVQQAKLYDQESVVLVQALTDAEAEVTPLDEVVPGVELFFKSQADLMTMDWLVDTLAEKGVVAMTYATDGRRTPATMEGEMPKTFVGLRLLYVPQFDESATAKNLAERKAEALEFLDSIVVQVQGFDEVSFADSANYKADVIWREEYDRFIDDSRAIEAGAGGEAAGPSGQRPSLLESVRLAAQRRERNRADNVDLSAWKAPQAVAAPVPLGGLIAYDNPFQTPVEVLAPIRGQVYSRFGELADHDTTNELKIYNLDHLINDPQPINDLMDRFGYRVRYFAFHNDQDAGVEWRLPKLKTHGYGDGYLWIYDPRVAHGSFKAPEYTRIWRIAHEMAHAITEQFMQARYGDSHREGALGRVTKVSRGKPPKNVFVDGSPLTLAEAQRAVEWEDVTFRAQRIIMETFLGVKVSDADFAREYNTNIADASYRVLTGDFGDPGEYGFKPNTRMPKLRSILRMLEASEMGLAELQGREPTTGTDLATWRPVSDVELEKAIMNAMKNRPTIKPLPGETAAKPGDDEIGPIKYKGGDYEGSIEPAGGPGSVPNAGVERAGEVTGIHYSNEAGISELSADRYGTGIKGAERQRLNQPGVDPRIKRRIYFYLSESNEMLPAREPGLGRQVYRASLSNMLDPTSADKAAMDKVKAIQQRRVDAGENQQNAFESAVVDAGFSGYINKKLGMAVVLNSNAKVDHLGKTDAPERGRAADVGRAMMQRSQVDQTKTPEFKRWFGDSKVVDADGNPLVVYHGTATDFDAFGAGAPQTEGGYDLAERGVNAFFFTPDPDIAAEYAEGVSSSARTAGDLIIPVYLSIKKPLIIDAKERPWGDFQDDIEAAFKSGKYDGVILKNVMDGMFEGKVSDVYAAFKDTQIKSSTGNDGTFGLDNGDIRFQRQSQNRVTTNVLRRAINRANRAGRVGGSALRGIGEFMFFSASSRVADIGTPTAKKLAAMFRTPVTAFDGQDAGPDPFLRSGAWTGRFVSELYKSLEPIRGRMGLSKHDNDALVAALRNGRPPLDPKLATAYRRLRTLLNDIHAYANGAGLDVGFVENYFPRIYDTDKIIARPEEFIQMLVDHGIPAPVARDIMQKIVDEEGVFESRVNQGGRLRDAQDFKPWARAMGAPGGRARATAEKARVINVPEDILRNWLVNDVDAVLANYAQGITKRAEYVRTFGPNEEILNQMVRDIIVEAEVEEVATTVQDIIDAAYSLADMSQGTYNPIRNMGARRAVRAISSFETVSKLGLVALTSLSEWAIVMGEGGRDAFVPLVKVFGDALNESTATFLKMTTGKRLLPKSEMRQAAEDIGLILPYVLEQKVSNRFAGASGATVTAFMKAVFLSQLTNLQRMVGYHSGLAMIKRHGQWLATGTPGSRSWDSRVERLRSMGISPEQAMAFARDGSFADIAGMAAMNLSYRMVQNPRPEDLPIVINDPHFSLFVQFKRFTASISNTLLKRYIEVARYGRAPWDKLQGLITAALATMAAYFATFLRDYVKWGDSGNPYRDDDSITGRLIESADRSGMLGHGTYLVAMAAPRYGYADSGAKRLFNLLGPAASDLGLIMDIAQDIREDKPDDAAKKMARLVPIMNVTDAGKTATAEALETPMTRLSDITLDVQDTLEDIFP